MKPESLVNTEVSVYILYFPSITKVAVTQNSIKSKRDKKILREVKKKKKNCPA